MARFTDLFRLILSDQASNVFWRGFCCERNMKKNLTLLLLISCTLQLGFAQEMVLKKGAVLDALPVNDSLQDTYALYLPTSFSTDKQWPLLMVVDMNGKQTQALSMFITAAEKEGYVLMAPQVRDSVSLSGNVVIATRALKKVLDYLPIQRSRIYSAGANSGGRFANLLPIFTKTVSGAISIGAAITNTELLNVRQPFHFIGIVNKENYNYPDLLKSEKVLERLRYPNQLLIHEAERLWPDPEYLQRALQFLTISAMRKGVAKKDSTYIQRAFNSDLVKANQLKGSMQLLEAEQFIGEMFGVYAAHQNLDSLRMVQKDIRRNKVYKSMKRGENAAFLKESLLKEDFLYYMDEDLVTYNFNNLGWWNFQREEIEKFINGSNPFEKQMGHRLLGFVNALAEDNIDLVMSEALIDEDALAFLYMLKTILEPENFEYYLKVISLSSKNEDFGTALFYLEEALKKGFDNTEKLYGLQHTALLKIDPRFNALVSKYLKDARYKVKEQ